LVTFQQPLAMATTSPSAKGQARLEPFHGVLSPGLSFSSGHTVLPYRYTATPLPLDAHNELWLVTPAGDRVLYVDPEAAGTYMATYHRFDRTVRASIDWTQQTPDSIDIHLEGSDGTTLELHTELGDTPATRLLTFVSRLTPSWLLRTAFGRRITNSGFQRLIASNGLQIVGQTETGEPFRVEADTIRSVEAATAELDGDDLGGLRTPYRRIAFGDHVIPDDTLLVSGALYLRPTDG
jgi:hypothetical protein